jgi:muconolactone delta-isomerase
MNIPHSKIGVLMSQETTPEAIAPKRPFPVLPTAKILALGRFTTPPTPEQVKAIFPREVPDTLQLYLDGKIEQMWARQDQKGPVFLMNVTSVAEAHSILEKLPLGQAKLMEFELVELTPLTPLHMLLTEGWANGTK